MIADRIIARNRERIRQEAREEGREEGRKQGREEMRKEILQQIEGLPEDVRCRIRAFSFSRHSRAGGNPYSLAMGKLP